MKYSLFDEHNQLHQYMIVVYISSVDNTRSK